MVVITSLKFLYLTQYNFTKLYVFGIKEYNKTHENFIGHHYHAKFKMAAIKSL